MKRKRILKEIKNLVMEYKALNEKYQYGKDKKMDVLNNLLDGYGNAGYVSYEKFIEKAKSRGVTLTIEKLKELLTNRSFMDGDQVYFVEFDNKNEKFYFDDPANI
tara:strand:- start:2186 stop:2500 length:315 start_codon:yes stop_codon:yes gene_type:complete